MAKKEKKQKKEKEKKSKKSRQREDANVPYAGSDGLKTFLARVLIILCMILVGLAIYTIHYINYNARSVAVRPAVELSVATETAPGSSETVVLLSDGLFARESRSFP